VSNVDEIGRLRAEVQRLGEELEQARVVAEDADERTALLHAECRQLRQDNRDRIAAHEAAESAAQELRNRLGRERASESALKAEQTRVIAAEEELHVTVEELQVLAEELETTNEALRTLNQELDRRVAERTRALAERNRALAEKEARLNLALLQAEACTWEWDVETDRLSWSAGFPALHGLRKDSPLSLGDWLERLDTADRERVSTALSELGKRTRGELVTEYRVNLAERGTRWLGARGRVMHMPGGPVRVFGLVTDITARKTNEAALLTVNAELNQRVETEVAAREEAQGQLQQRQKLEAIGQLTGGVAHDFNNVLTVIQGGLNLLESITEPERRQRLMRAIWDATERGANLTRQLLAFGRRQALKPERIELSGSMERICDFLRHSLREHIEIVAEIPPDTWAVRLDPGALELALLNLATNARDAMPNGGRITIRAANRQLAEAEADHLGLGSGEHVALAIADQGLGMSGETLERAFEPFFTTKGLGHGTGLGLAQVYGFARQSGGTATIRSRQDHGTTVTLILPRAPETAPAPGPGMMEEGLADATSRGRILVVEDDPTVASVVMDLLVQFGHAAQRAETAEAALKELASADPFDMVFSDVLLPGGASGLDLAREITRTRPGLPIVLTTGYSGSAAEQAEAASYTLLRKPYTARELASVVNQAIAATKVTAEI